MIIYILVAASLFVPAPALAIIPPDMIVSVGANLLSILGIIALALTTIYSALFVFVRQGFLFAKRYIIPILLITNVAAGSLLYWHISEQTARYALIQEEATMLRNTIQSLSQQTDTKATSSPRSSVLSPCARANQTDECVPGKRFFSDTYVIQNDEIAIEFNVNRIELAPDSNLFHHYFFINGAIGNRPFSSYVDTLASTSLPIAHGIINYHTIEPAPDLSPRARHEFSLDINGIEVQVKIDEIAGDFVTRDSLNYTRTQSVANARVFINNRESMANAMVEQRYSASADEGIFFPGLDELDITTVQFIVWDTVGNFYLFDQTQVANPVPEYTSHLWLLKKHADGLTQKSFTGSYEQIGTGSKRAFTVSLPEFASATMTLSIENSFKTDIGRERAVVYGIVRDSAGERPVRGIAHLIN